MRQLSEGEGNQHYDSREGRKTFSELTKKFEIRVCHDNSRTCLLLFRPITQDKRSARVVIKLARMRVCSPVAAVVGCTVSVFDRQPKTGAFIF